MGYSSSAFCLALIVVFQDVEEGISHVVSIYIDILTRLMAEHEFYIYVHPVVPVLNETRYDLVNVKYNILKSLTLC